MLRFILAVIFLFSYLVLGIPVLGVEWIIGKFNKEKADYQQLRMIQWGFRQMLAIAGVKITVIGKERIPDEPVLYVANHRSYFDILVGYVLCEKLTGFVAKKELLKFYLLRDWMRRVYCLFLDRENAREGLKTILTAVEYIKQGVSIFIFPEGTRNSGEELSMLPFAGGSFKIAEKSGCPVVPVSMNNTADIFENHLPRLKPTHVIVEYGEPIYMDQLERSEKKKVAERCQNIIQETITKNQALV